MSSTKTKKSIVVVGGGASGVAAAAALDNALKTRTEYEIVLVTGSDYCYHFIAGLRACVSDADLAEQISIPYDRVFKDASRSRVITKRAVEVKADRIVLEDGSELAFAYAVIATGKQWDEPLNLPAARTEAIAHMKTYRDKIARAKNIVIIGGGAVGLEMAGEIAEAYPPASGKKVTVIHNRSKVLNDVYSDKLRVPLQKQAEEMGVSFILNDSLEQGEQPFKETPQSLRTKNGKVLDGVDLVIIATGGKVNTGPLEKLVPSLINRNGVKVEPTFQIPGFKNIFAIGDLADLPEQKQAAKAVGHSALAAKNIVADIHGKPLTSYKRPNEMGIIILGSTGGAGQITVPIFGTFYPGAWFSKTVKGKKLFVGMARSALGY